MIFSLESIIPHFNHIFSSIFIPFSSRHNRRLEDKLEDTKGRVYTDSLDDKESLLKSEISNDTENAWLAELTDDESWTVEYFEL